MLQIVYLKLACYSILVHQTLAIIWCYSVSVNIFMSYFTSELVSIG